MCVCTHAYSQAEILKSAATAAAKTPVCSGFSQITYSFIELLKDMKLLNYEADKKFKWIKLRCKTRWASSRSRATLSIIQTDYEVTHLSAEMLFSLDFFSFWFFFLIHGPIPAGQRVGAFIRKFIERQAAGQDGADWGTAHCLCMWPSETQL